MSSRRDDGVEDDARSGRNAKASGESDSDRDDDRDDPLMQSMRAVWVSMRDEEPPTTGLSALLAAAREKAEAMQPEVPWWQRMLVVLRRPPVLALATVVVLVGGAVVITNRRGEVEAPPPVVTSNADGYAAGKQEPRKGTNDTSLAAPEKEKFQVGRDHDDGQERATQTKPPTEQPTPNTPRRPPLAQSPRIAEPAPPPPPAPGHGYSRPRTPDPEVGGGLVRGDASGSGAPGTASGETAETITVETPPKRVETTKDLEIARDEDGVDAPRDNAPKAPVNATGRAPEADTSAQSRRTSPSAEQLVKQCESAAARGDCAAVRVMAERIKKVDANVYRERLERNAAVARCLK